MIEALARDIQYAARGLRKSPVFSSVAVVTLALAIGANTVIFSVVEAVLLRPLPYPQPGRLVVSGESLTWTDFESWKAGSTCFSDLAAFYRPGGRTRVVLSGFGEPEPVTGGFVSANLSSLLGVSPAAGRWFTFSEEVRRERVIVLSHGLWVQRFGASPQAIGKTLDIDGFPACVIGVMPASFPFPARDVQFWAPVTINRYWNEAIPFDPNFNRNVYARWDVVARLKPGVGLAQAQAGMQALNDRLEQTAPDRNRAAAIRLLPMSIPIGANTRLALLALEGAVLFVLLIASSNVANLMLARGAARRREIALRVALGANRGRLAQQLLVESALLALGASAAGLILAHLGIRTLIAFGPPDIPRLEETRLDPGVLFFALSLAPASAILCGLLPAWKISQAGPFEVLQSGGHGVIALRTASRTRSLLVVAEFALSTVLLTGAGLLMRSFLAIEAVDPGFRPDHVLTLRVTLPAGTSAIRRIAFEEQMLKRLRAIPGVQAVGGINGLWTAQPGNFGLRSVEGLRPDPSARSIPLAWNAIRGDYFQAMGTRLLHGRFFSERDGPDAPLVAVVDETLARRYWPGQDPIGKRFKGFDARGRHDDWLTVIGVVADMRRHGREQRPAAHVFEWWRQAPASATPDLVVRTTTNPREISASLRAALHTADQSALLSPIRTLEDELSEQLAPRRFQTWLLTLFSLIALVLAGTGIFGVMHGSVTQRTQEIGIRMALGAPASRVRWMILGQATRMAAIGVAIGAAGAVWLTQFLSGLLFGVSPGDPATFVATSVLLAGVAIAASWIPARRAAGVDPLCALRSE